PLISRLFTSGEKRRTTRLRGAFAPPPNPPFSSGVGSAPPPRPPPAWVPCEVGRCGIAWTVSGSLSEPRPDGRLALPPPGPPAAPPPPPRPPPPPAPRPPPPPNPPGPPA